MNRSIYRSLMLLLILGLAACNEDSARPTEELVVAREAIRYSGISAQEAAVVAELLPHADVSAYRSPDGRLLAFFDEGATKKVVDVDIFARTISDYRTLRLTDDEVLLFDSSGQLLARHFFGPLSEPEKHQELDPLSIGDMCEMLAFLAWACCHPSCSPDCCTQSCADARDDYRQNCMFVRP